MAPKYTCSFRTWMTIVLLAVTGLCPAVGARPFRVVTVQHQVFEPFTQALQGFIEGIRARGDANRIQIVENYNADSNLANLDAKIEELRQRKDVDLIFSIGTHSTKRLIRRIHNIPIVFTIVADPEHSGIVTNWKSSGANYTGVETPDYDSKLIRLMALYVPFKRLGMIYLKGSPSHEAGIRQVAELAKERGFKFVRRGFALRDAAQVPFPKDVIRQHIRDALEAVCPQVDAFFVQTSNTFTRNFDLFDQAFKKYRIVSAGDPTNIRKGLVMGIGKDARRFGDQCADYAIRILIDKIPPADLPMDVGKHLTIIVNLHAAEQVGFKPPFELLSGADEIIR